MALYLCTSELYMCSSEFYFWTGVIFYQIKNLFLFCSFIAKLLSFHCYYFAMDMFLYSAY